MPSKVRPARKSRAAYWGAVVVTHRQAAGDVGWPEIWELNRDRDMGGGRVFTNPSVRSPGWVLHLPVAATVTAPEAPPEPPQLPAPTPALPAPASTALPTLHPTIEPSTPPRITPALPAMTNSLLATVSGAVQTRNGGTSTTARRAYRSRGWYDR